MREYQPAGVLIAAANGNYTYASTASIDQQPLSIEHPISVDSQFSLLIPTVSLPSSGLPTQQQQQQQQEQQQHQQQQCDWPEFHESYNSIMDNTNLLDSCAAALNDINSENGLFTSMRMDKLRHEFNRSVSSSATTSSISGSDNHNSTDTTKRIEQYVQWLCEMECRVAAQPKLSRIVAMNPREQIEQLNIHSNIFQEIVTRPCIIKNPKRNDYKSIEERYHLLYLKVYEVLLLLDGLPTKSLSPSKRIFSESFHDFSARVHENRTSSTSSQITESADHIDYAVDAVLDKTHSSVTTPAYTETKILSTSIGTYYFNYDDTIGQQTDKNDREKLCSTILECNDKEFTFEHDLHSLLNTSDSLGHKSHDHTFAMSNEQNFVELDTIDSDRESALSLAQHKVYSWLNTNAWKSKSSDSLDCSTASEADYYQLIYRAKSEIDLSINRPMNPINIPSTLRNSLNYLPSPISPIKQYESKLNESIIEENSLIWDNFQMGHDSLVKLDSDDSFIGNDSDAKELGNRLCYFGDDYSLHLNEMNIIENALDANVQNENDTRGVNALSPPPKESLEIKRSRRIRKKRSRHSSMQSVANSTSSSKCSSLSATATTASTADSEKHCESMQSNQSIDKFTPEKTISYNSNEKQFELRTKESIAPMKMKINEMRPEDFYDIVKMCQSNIDCVITVLGADPNRTLTIAYCQQMKFERNQKSDAETTCKCKQEHNDNATNPMVNSPRAKYTECKCSNVPVKNVSDPTELCICAWVSHTIAMILNFLMDCWNIFRNMKLYTYLCRVTKALFGSTRYVADHLKSKHGLTNAKAIKYS